MTPITPLIDRLKAELAVPGPCVTVMHRDLRELVELVEKIPKTADGKIVLPGDQIFHVESGGHISELAIGWGWEKRDTTSRPLPAYARERDCYSTTELAEAALSAKKACSP